MRKHIHAEREKFNTGVSIAMIVEDGEKALMAQPLTLQEFNPEEPATNFMYLKQSEAQELMDELWHCGLRPSEGTGSAGSLAATERHLKDMQNIAIGALKKIGVNV